MAHAERSSSYTVIEADDFHLLKHLESKGGGGWRGSNWTPTQELDRDKDFTRTEFATAQAMFPGRSREVLDQIARGWKYVEHNPA